MNSFCGRFNRPFSDLTMKNVKRLVSLVFSVSFCFILSAGHAAALGPQAGNCSWGNYSKSNTTYLSASSGTNNQSQINAAIASAPSGGSVFLKAGTYVISGSILMKSNVTLEGDKDAVVKLKDHAGWRFADGLPPLIGIASNGASKNVEIKCFTIDGNYSFNNGNKSSAGCWSGKDGIKWDSSASAFAACEKQSGGDRYHGKGYYTVMSFNYANNLSVHDMVMRDSAGDGLRVQHSSNIKFYDNTVNAMGHEVLFANVSHGIEMYGNDMKLRASGGARGDDCYDYVIHDNVFESYNHKDSSAGVQIDSKSGLSVYNVQIYRNVFTSVWNVGVWLSKGSISKHNGDYPVKIHHNIFVGNGYSNNSQVGATGGIVSNGSICTVIYNNVFDGNYGSGIYNTGPGSEIFNNIIVGTRSGKAGGGSGGGVAKASNASYNCFNDNSGGNLLSSSGTNNISANPLFANKSAYDYHIKSKAGRWDPSLKKWVADSVNSPCIDAGIPAKSNSVYGDYSKEPENNGDGVNAGLYGNTSQASLTGNSPQSPVPPDPVEEDYPDNFSGGGEEEGGGDEPVLPIYPYDPNSPLPDIEPPEYVLPALPDEEIPVTPLYPTPADVPGTAKDACTVKENSAGLIPCGKNLNDPATSWNECQECGLCAFVLMIQLILEYLLKIMGIIAVLALVVSGVHHILAAGNAGKLEKAKKMAERVVLGFVMALMAWIVVDFVLSALGFIDPVAGDWYVVCDSAGSGNSSNNNN